MQQCLLCQPPGYLLLIYHTHAAPDLQSSLAHFEDLQQRIPRADIARFEAAVRELCFAMLGALWWEAFGARFRRRQCLTAGQAMTAECYAMPGHALHDGADKNESLFACCTPAERHGATDVERTFCFACGSYK